MMNARIMKYVGIIIMILAHPIGYHFWTYIILGPLAYAPEYDIAVHAVLVGIGILGFFLIGLTLFVIGLINHQKRPRD